MYKVINKLTINFDKQIPLKHKRQILKDIESNNNLKWKRLELILDRSKQTQTGSRTLWLKQEEKKREYVYYLSDYPNESELLALKTKELLRNSLLSNNEKKDKYRIDFTLDSSEKITTFVIEE